MEKIKFGFYTFLYVFFIGYKNIVVPVWLMFPYIFFFCAMEDWREMFKSDMFFPVWMFSTLIFYVLYFMFLKFMYNTKVRPIINEINNPSKNE